jgi:hypothetical protein
MRLFGFKEYEDKDAWRPTCVTNPEDGSIVMFKNVSAARRAAKEWYGSDPRANSDVHTGLSSVGTPTTNDILFIIAFVSICGLIGYIALRHSGRVLTSFGIDSVIYTREKS